MHYTGKLMDGTVFDSSVTRGTPFEFTLGAREVILGWDKGVATMRKGEKAILECAPEYAYGDMGAGGVIPPKATLRFEVELLGWKEAGGMPSISTLLQVRPTPMTLKTLWSFSPPPAMHRSGQRKDSCSQPVAAGEALSVWDSTR